MHCPARTPVLAFPLVMAGLAMLFGCRSAPLFPDRCTVLIATISPNPPALSVGDSVTLTAAYTGAVECQPDAPASALHWTSSDPTVAPVDSLSGVVRARAPGTTEITVHAPGTLAVLGATVVSVGGP
jgi:hypothetical protein